MSSDDDEFNSERNNLSFLLTLLTMLDFQESGSVSREDWERGVAALYAPGLSHEVSWKMLLRRFDLDSSGAIEFGEMHGLAPLDPRLGALLRVITQTVVRLSERINGAYAGLQETKLKLMKGTINQWRGKCTTAAFNAWRDLVRRLNAQRMAVIGNLRYAPCRKCLHALHKLVSTKKAQMSRAAAMIRGGDTALKLKVFDRWRTAHFGDKEAKNKKLRMYLMGRDEWWKQHIIDSWRTSVRHERGLQKFVTTWLFQGMVRTFVAWQRHVRAAVAERNRGLAKGMAMLLRGTECKAFGAWRDSSRVQIAEREAVLRKQLMRKAKLFGAQVVRAWFEWYMRKLRAKKRVCWGVSVAGMAFRAWLGLIDGKRRREFLHWALGPNLEVLGDQVKEASAILRGEITKDAHAMREEINAHTRKLREEVALERDAVREELLNKPDGRELEAARAELEAARLEIAALRKQLAQHEVTHRTLAAAASTTEYHLTEQLHVLAREIEERMAQARRDAEMRARVEDQQMAEATEKIRIIQQSKANHEELLHLVHKLQQRPKPGQPLGIQPLLTVPYPLPPGQPISSTARRPSRPISASAHRGGGSQGHLDGTAEFREVPTCIEETARTPYVSTSEQILLRHLPADADQGATPLSGAGGSRGRLVGAGREVGGRVLVPPASHSPALSARASATAHAIVANKRPASARTGGAANVSMFSQRTDLFARSLGSGERLPETTMPGMAA